MFVPIQSAPKAEDFARIWKLYFTAAVRSAAAQDGRDHCLSLSEAKSIQNRPDFLAHWGDNAVDYLQASGQKAIRVKKIIGDVSKEVLEQAKKVAGDNNLVSLVEARKLAKDLAPDFFLLRTGSTSLWPGRARTERLRTEHAQEGDEKVEYEDRPANQPLNRFRGAPNVPTRPADPLPAWLGGPFEKAGIVLEPNPENAWEARTVFNPTTVVKDGKVYMLYRAEDDTGLGRWNGTSRFGLAQSEDGIHFTRLPEPVLEPTEPYELPGGIEDPRIAELPDCPEGRYVLTYTAFDGTTARLALAVSDDLVNWKKMGLVFSDEEMAQNPVVPSNPAWSKAGAIVPQRIQSKDPRVDGKYVMYFGEGRIFMATSDDGIHWHHDAASEPVLDVRPGFFDSLLAEPGPTPWVDEEGIHLLYNGDAPPWGYSVGEVVFDKSDPRRIIRRSSEPHIKPSEDYELTGQVGNVIFAEGLARLDNRVLLYYGAADGKIAVAVAPASDR